MSTPRPAPYTAGQAVEVEIIDFDTPGFPRVFVAATVTDVTVKDDGLYAVSITTCKGTYAHQIVGKRGGNRLLRAA